MNRKTGHLVVPVVIALCAASPFAAVQLAGASGQAGEGAALVALALPTSAVTSELSGRTPHPPKPKPGGGGGSGYVWGVGEADPTWQEQLRDMSRDRSAERAQREADSRRAAEVAAEQEARRQAEDARNAAAARQAAYDKCHRDAFNNGRPGDDPDAVCQQSPWVQG